MVVSLTAFYLFSQPFSFAESGESPEVVAGAVQALRNAHAERSPLPLVSRTHGILSLETAYRIQNQVANGPRAGYKAALTGPETQQRFGIAHPLAGVVLREGSLPRDRVVNRREFGVPMMEMEMVLIVGRNVDIVPESGEALRPFLVAAAPAMEFPDLHVDDPEHLTAIDLVAGNTGFRKYLLGHEVPLEQVNFDTLHAELMRDREQLTRGKVSDIMGGPLEVGAWLVRHCKAQGHPVRKGDFLFTGVIGHMLPMQDGDYVADFGPLGPLPFRVRSMPRR